MIDISVNGLVKYFGDVQLFSQVTFELYEGEKVGLIGSNGAGKTTLMKILIAAASAESGGDYAYDDGQVAIAKNRRVGLIEQLPVFPAGHTVEQVLETAFERLDAMRTQITELEHAMASDPSDALLREYGELLSRFEHAGGYNTAYMLDKVANGLGITAEMRTQLFESLSGGEKTRVNLARVILEETDILLLDEPTNHLDIDAVEWLGEYISAYRGTVLIISHDRYFLDQAIERIVEIENGVSEEYDGNYSYYAVEKQRRYEEKLEQWEAAEREKQRLEAVARRFRSWATEKMVKRALTVERKIAKMNVGDRPRRQRRLAGRLSEAEFFADDALKLRELSFAYGDRPMVKGASVRVGGGERVAIYGPNGCGKTTLLRLVTGELTPDAGSVLFGPQIRWAYLPQQVHFDHMERTVLDTLLYSMSITPQAARTRLGAFRFTGEEVFKPLTALSGGERSRLKLCMLMHDELNMLILDEPTNHLDLASREWIEDVLEGFGGVILFVSHDRYFVTRFASRVWELGNGEIRDFRCGFEEFRERTRAQAESVLRRTAEPVQDTQQSQPAQQGKAKRRTGGSPLKRLEQCRKETAALEQELVCIETDMETHGSDYVKLAELLPQKEAAEERLLHAYAELEALEQEAGETGPSR